MLLTVDVAPWLLRDGPVEKAEADTRRLEATKNFILTCKGEARVKISSSNNCNGNWRNANCISFHVLVVVEKTEVYLC